MNTEIKAMLKAHFTSEEVTQIESFLDRGFSQNGQIVIASIFLFAKENQKSFAEVLSECEKEWKRNWGYQHPDIKGDADAPGIAGIQNRASLENIYGSLKIPSPFSPKVIEIPTEAITVITENSVYRFGKANQKRERTVFREEKPLDFVRCRIISLAVGEDMELRCFDSSHLGWYTTPVRLIKQEGI